TRLGADAVASSIAAGARVVRADADVTTIRSRTPSGARASSSSCLALSTCASRPWRRCRTQTCTLGGRNSFRAPSESKLPFTLSELKQIPVRILEPCGVAPRELEDLGSIERHAARLQRLERRPDVFDLEGIDRGTGLPLCGCAWPQNELEVLALDADSQ